MNTIRATFFLVALSLAGGCASVAPTGSELVCAGAPMTTIRIKYKRHSKISTDDSIVVVNRGDAINYKVNGPEARAFKAKGTKAPPNSSASFAWLDATGSGGPGGRPHIICVPDDQASGDYEYEIKIEGVGTLDPVVHVN